MLGSAALWVVVYFAAFSFCCSPFLLLSLFAAVYFAAVSFAAVSFAAASFWGFVGVRQTAHSLEKKTAAETERSCRLAMKELYVLFAFFIKININRSQMHRNS